MLRFRQNVIPFVSAVSMGIGVYLGSKYERYKDENPVWDFLKWPTVMASTKPIDRSRDSSVPNVSQYSTSADRIMKFGYPSLENLRVYDDFVLSYDRRNRNAHWVFEHLTPDKLNQKNVDRSKSQFCSDNVIHEKFRSLLADFKHSGFDRGHLAAAGNHRHDQRAMDQTFTLSNISPQVSRVQNLSCVMRKPAAFCIYM